MKLPLSRLPPEYDDWVEGVEPAWTALEPALVDSLLGEPEAENGVLRLSVDLKDEELAGSAFVSNALTMLRAAAEADGLKVTPGGNLTRANVSAMRAAMDWPGSKVEEDRRAGKVLSEHHVEELRLVRALVEEAGLAEQAGGRFRVGGRRWACGRAAAQALAKRIGSKAVACEERDRDRYGRVVAVCGLSGVDLNAWIVAEGWALAYRRYSGDYVAMDEMLEPPRMLA